MQITEQLPTTDVSEIEIILEEQEQLAKQYAELDDQIKCLTREKNALRALMEARMQRLGPKNIETSWGNLSLVSKPSEMSLTMSDLAFVKKFPQLSRPNFTAIRKEYRKLKRIEMRHLRDGEVFSHPLMEAVIEDDDTGCSLRFSK